MRRQRALQLDATPVQSANFRFRIVLKGNRKVATDKTAERLVQTLGFLHVKRERGKALGKHFPFRMETFNTVLARRTAKNRQRRKTRITPLTVGNFHDHRLFQLVNAEYAVIKRLRIAFDQVQIFRAVGQTFKLFGYLR
ncbi:Uncharacterised protein [Salmonella enterica subsp. enterica serovar Bovismorbificans]|uniref:Uncharacterized protein n=1 Tax=Salmonella enterica subsp. enterica serovar Bovismorbificans TaxID=58097 RepID=A0A655DQ65_SALET|nr:Uncharacterised protein [Salmonella enterica subsp. enterica serovar Bovismorbificans]CPR41404.1 Uncharacterised protein [Salmonella enterica subsp. enterica serovar Bovismorbificans]CPR44720.1 Uncharacterised protein [Salmonella enterica subsp. enterica serovar Bovismorbificans]CQB62335.1 Uncharacterised protein [Salmonella enterica subsp. enterica serovar Bovismorbificans]CQF13886.1 Uncharacterised protein [Salmonella enterica subsp. enterica serovar Typhimurium str. DT104]